jgi:hypothetical protein
MVAKKKGKEKEEINLCKYCGKPAAIQHPNRLKDLSLVDKCYDCFLIYSDCIADAAIAMYGSPPTKEYGKKEKKQSEV